MYEVTYKDATSVVSGNMNLGKLGYCIPNVIELFIKNRSVRVYKSTKIKMIDKIIGLEDGAYYLDSEGNKISINKKVEGEK